MEKFELLNATAHPPVFQFENLSAFPELYHAVFTRQGGGSLAPYNSLNVACGVGDAPESVQGNRICLLRATGLPALFYAGQVHGREVCHVDETVLNHAINASEPVQADALVTSCKGIGLVIQVADCQAVLLYDPVCKVVANIHAGWRGSIANIIGRTIAVMQETSKSRPADIYAAIGPSLGPCCAEFIHYHREIPQAFWRFGNERRYFDFWDISMDQLRAAGVSRTRIECSRLCTVCNGEWFFSYRRDRVTGRNGVVIGLL